MRYFLHIFAVCVGTCTCLSTPRRLENNRGGGLVVSLPCGFWRLTSDCQSSVAHTFIYSLSHLTSPKLVLFVSLACCDFCVTKCIL